jgi:tetratricopeptide (TPR) repeat protein
MKKWSVCFVAPMLWSQSLADFNGEVRAHDTSNFVIELVDARRHVTIDRTDIGGGGSFSFHQVESGDYELRVLDSEGNELASKPVQILPNSWASTTIELPDKPKFRAAGVISVSQLREQIPMKALQLVVKAQRHSESGKYEDAVRELEKALRKAPQFRDAHANLGVQYLRLKRTAEALRELKIAAIAEPPIALHYANLGFTLVSIGQLEQGRDALEKAMLLQSADRRVSQWLRWLNKREITTLFTSASITKP